MLSLLQEQSSSGRQSEEALLQAAALHLAIGLRLYFRELATYLDIKHPEAIFSLSDLTEKLTPYSPLHEIESQNWVDELIAVERQITSPPLEESDSPQLIARSAGGLAGKNISISAETIKKWLEEFQQMCERQRASLVEY